MWQSLPLPVNTILAIFSVGHATAWANSYSRVSSRSSKLVRATFVVCVKGNQPLLIGLSHTHTQPPTSPHNCSVQNRTRNSLDLGCLPGNSGGLQQIFHLQVYSLNPNKLLQNLNNTEAPYFAIKDLPAGYIFKLVIYSSNRKGKSKAIDITGSTTEASPWKSGNKNPQGTFAF